MGVVQRRENVALALSPVDEKKLPVGLEIPRRGGAELRNGRAFGALRGALRVGRYGAASRRKVRRIGYDKIETFTLERRAPVIGADGLAALFKRKGAQILPRACRGALPDIHAGHAAAFIAQQEKQ